MSETNAAVEETGGGPKRAERLRIVAAGLVWPAVGGNVLWSCLQSVLDVAQAPWPTLTALIPFVIWLYAEYAQSADPETWRVEWVRVRFTSNFVASVCVTLYCHAVVAGVHKWKYAMIAAPIFLAAMLLINIISKSACKENRVLIAAHGAGLVLLLLPVIAEIAIGVGWWAGSGFLWRIVTDEMWRLLLTAAVFWAILAAWWYSGGPE